MEQKLMAALRQATSAAGNVVPQHHSPMPPHCFGTDRNERALEFIQHVLTAATSMREHFQRRQMQLLEVLGNPENIGELRLHKGASGKPRIALGASINDRGTLHVSWQPLGPKVFNSYSGGTNSDHCTWSSIGQWHGVPFDTVIRLLERDYEAIRYFARPDYERDAKDYLHATLQGCLNCMLRTLACVAEVVVLNWVTTENGRIVTCGVHTRALALIQADGKGRAQGLADLTAEYQQCLAQMKLESVDKYDELVATAAVEGKKLSRVIYEATGKRCISTQTERFDELRRRLKAEAAHAVDAERSLSEFRKLRNSDLGEPLQL